MRSTNLLTYLLTYLLRVALWRLGQGDKRVRGSEGKGDENDHHRPMNNRMRKKSDA